MPILKTKDVNKHKTRGIKKTNGVSKTSRPVGLLTKAVGFKITHPLTIFAGLKKIYTTRRNHDIESHQLQTSSIFTKLSQVRKNKKKLVTLFTTRTPQVSQTTKKKHAAAYHPNSQHLNKNNSNIL